MFIFTDLKEIVKNSDPLIDLRVKEFILAGQSGKEKLFSELCFCILAANTSAEMGIRVMNSVNLDHFLYSDLETLRSELKKVSCRFYNMRSKFIVDSRWIIDELPEIARTGDSMGTREYLAENLMGVGYKESSHFLRNVGKFECAILDKHILRMMNAWSGTDLKASLSKKKYLEIEDAFIKMSDMLNMKPGVLDLYMWKMATGKVLK
ncbi:MAG: N-glycosylase/DNA lyase [Candidatus Thermoplasmatota archaeon]|jgi:N-glycosylase/DNA lyase|nr:N-glycosylase/DNA lyase [Candidatus Thermoplasmatota archaeon]